MELENLKKQKERYTTKIFYLGLKIALIFAIPAVIGVLIGKRVDAYYGTHNKWSIGILAFTFVLSWIITIVMYNNISKNIKKVEDEIKKEKEKNKEREEQKGLAEKKDI